MIEFGKRGLFLCVAFTAEIRNALTSQICLQYVINGHGGDNSLVSPESHSEGKDNRIPLLKEVFEAFPQTPVNIDIKVNNNVLIRKVRVKV